MSLNLINRAGQATRPVLSFFLFGRLVVPGRRRMRSMFCVPALLPSRSMTASMRASTSSILALSADENFPSTSLPRTIGSFSFHKH